MSLHEQPSAGASQPPFAAWFRCRTGCEPYAWQQQLAADADCRNRLIRIPTGLGKTMGAFMAWLYHRVERGDDRWPRRLVWCLPMRVLVEQVERELRRLLGDQAWDGIGEHEGRVGVHRLMGGADAGEWQLYPEHPAVLVGTQDMLLSRALNRGYASPRARWPMEFGLLNQDALWIMDEVQLMDAGLATSAQLQCFRDQDAAKGLRPCRTWWMSATLQPAWLRSVDTEAMVAQLERDMLSLPAASRVGPLWGARKALAVSDARTPQQLAKLAWDEHATLDDGEHGRITLVVLNTVERAREVHRALQALRSRQESAAPELRLVHSRFRPAERLAWQDAFLQRAHCRRGANRIIVATQVVEAGVDISAGRLVTDLAPWPSLVQRFGRAARYGGEARVTVVVPDDERLAKLDGRPYRADDLRAAAGLLCRLVDSSAGVSLAALQDAEDRLADQERGALYAYAPQHLLQRRDYDDLFDTTPDLTGADLDIARFIRTGDDRDCLVFWDAVPETAAPSPQRRPHRDELCPVPCGLVRDWLFGAKGASGSRRDAPRAWMWDWLDGAWVAAKREAVLPGRVLCIAADQGGYLPEVGFDPDSRVPVPLPSVDALPDAVALQEATDDSQDGDALSHAGWKTIACHGGEVAAEARRLAAALQLPDPIGALLELAGRWHDAGKAHPAFQERINRHAPGHPGRGDLAKAPSSAWQRAYRCADGERPGFRHELASALALFAVLRHYEPQHAALLGAYAEWFASLDRALPSAATDAPSPVARAVLGLAPSDFDLLAYLVAAHHGKVRVSLQAAPADQDFRPPAGDRRGLPIRGVREGDVLPALLLDPAQPPLPPLALTLAPAAIGLSPVTGPSWRDRTQRLQARYGPAALAFLEALVMVADRRASRLNTVDPLCTPAGTPSAPLVSPCPSTA